MADYRNPDISNLPHFPTLSDDPSLEQFYNSLDGPLISPSPEFCVSNSNPGLNIGQDQGQGDSIADFLIDIVEDFSRDWDCVDVEANQKEERRARKRIMDKRRQTRLNRGFAVLRSLLPKIGNTKRNTESDLTGALEYLKELKQRIQNLEMEFQSSPTSTNIPLPIDMRTMIQPSLFSPVPNFDTDQPKVEVETDNNGNVNIHMLCESRPDLFRAVMYSLDLLKIDVQQATATCYNGFKLDILNAKQCNDGQFWNSEDIKSVLMLCARGA